MTVVIRQAQPCDAAIVSAMLAEAAQWVDALGEVMWDTGELAPERIAIETAAGQFPSRDCRRRAGRRNPLSTRRHALLAGSSSGPHVSVCPSSRGQAALQGTRHLDGATTVGARSHGRSADRICVSTATSRGQS